MTVEPRDRVRTAGRHDVPQIVDLRIRYLGEMNRSLDWELSFTGGVHHDRILTGRILTGLNGGTTLVGMAPVLADRMCAAAPHGAILVSERVRAAGEGAGEFEFERSDVMELDGAPVYRVVAR